MQQLGEKLVHGVLRVLQILIRHGLGAARDVTLAYQRGDSSIKRVRLNLVIRTDVIDGLFSLLRPAQRDKGVDKTEDKDGQQRDGRRLQREHLLRLKLALTHRLLT